MREDGSPSTRSFPATQSTVALNGSCPGVEEIRADAADKPFEYWDGVAGLNPATLGGQS